MAKSNASSATTGNDEKVFDIGRTRKLMAEWGQAEREAAAAKARADKLKEQFRAAMTALGAEVGTIDGIKVLSHIPTENFRRKEFAEERPDLVDHYTIRKTVEVIDLDRLKAEQPEVFAKFQSKSLRPDWKAFAKVTDLAAARRTSR